MERIVKALTVFLCGVALVLAAMVAVSYLCGCQTVTYEFKTSVTGSRAAAGPPAVSITLQNSDVTVQKPVEISPARQIRDNAVEGIPTQ